MNIRTMFPALASLVLVACVSDPAKDAPKATVAPPAVTAVVAPPSNDKAETLAIDAGGSKLLWTGSKVTRSHPGGFKTFSGSITLADGKPEASKVDIEIDMNSIFTNNDMLLGHLKSADFFDTATHPKATFATSSITAGGTDGATHTVKGNLTMRGVTKEVTFPATISVGEKDVTAKAKFSINRQDWGVAWKGTADDLVRDDVLIEWDITAKRG